MSVFKNKNSLRTIEAKFPKRLRTMRLGQNLLVLIKKSVYCPGYLIEPKPTAELHTF